jgi:hypothetical protein
MRLKADPSKVGEIGAPMSGVVVEIRLKGNFIPNETIRPPPNMWACYHILYTQ